MFHFHSIFRFICVRERRNTRCDIWFFSSVINTTDITFIGRIAIHQRTQMILMPYQTILISRNRLISTNELVLKSLRPKLKLVESSCSHHSSKKLMRKVRYSIRSILNNRSLFIRMDKPMKLSHLVITQSKRIWISQNLKHMPVFLTSTTTCAKVTSKNIVST